MLSISNDSSPTIGGRILDAAAYCVIAYGVDRVTLAEIARRARVSRPTVYRRWPDTRSVLAALLTTRIVRVLDDVPSRGVGREALVERIVGVAEHLRRDDVVMSVLRKAPDLAMVYIAERLGTSQQILIDAVAAEIKLAQEEGSVRSGDPRQLAARAHSLNGYLKP
jgi:AcrR family transcriptional regulator